MDWITGAQECRKISIDHSFYIACGGLDTMFLGMHDPLVVVTTQSRLRD